MLEQAAKEVVSAEAKREIAIAQVGIRNLQQELKTAMREDTTIKEAIKLCRRVYEEELAERLEDVLNTDRVYTEWITEEQAEKMILNIQKRRRPKKIEELLPGSKLSERQVITIFLNTKATRVRLAKRYKVSYQTIKNIQEGRTWSSITDKLEKVRNV